MAGFREALSFRWLLLRVSGLSAVVGMERLIDDLMALAQVTRTELQVVNVDLTALCRDVVKDLRENEPQREVEVTLEEGMACTGDAGLLRPVLTWKTRVTLVRTLPAGWGISYGRTHILEKPTRVATLASGYGDGYPYYSGSGYYGVGSAASNGLVLGALAGGIIGHAMGASPASLLRRPNSIMRAILDCVATAGEIRISSSWRT